MISVYKKTGKNFFACGSDVSAGLSSSGRVVSIFLAFESTMGLEVQDNNEIFAQHLRTKRSSSNRLDNFMLRIEDRSILRLKPRYEYFMDVF